MVELIEMFTQDLPTRISDIESSVSQSDWEQLRIIAHQLKGAAPSYGFDCIGVVADKIEQHIKSGHDPEDIVKEVDDLVSLCRRAAMPEGEAGA